MSSMSLISVKLSASTCVSVIYKNINALSLSETHHGYTDLCSNLYWSHDMV